MSDRTRGVAKSRTRSIIVANVGEFDVRVMGNAFTADERRLWDEIGIELADMALFWHGDNKVVVSSRPYESTWLSDISEWLGFCDIQNLSPENSAGSLSLDCVTDTRTLNALIASIQGVQAPELITWGVVPSTYTLLDALRSSGAVVAPELTPLDALWTVDYLDSKTGFRELCTKLRLENPDLRVPEGFTCSTVDQAIGIASHFIRQGRGFVVKAHQGVAGRGVLLYPPTKLTVGLDSVRQDLTYWLESDREIHTSLFRNGPLTVEQYIEPADDPSLRYPTYDAVITPDGTVKTIGIGAMLVDDQFYQGVVVGDEVFSAAFERLIVCIGEAVGSAMAGLGYRGWFDVDFVLGADGYLYATEINARRTSPTHAFEILPIIRAREPRVKCALANDHFELPSTSPLSYAMMRSVFADFQARPPVSDCFCLPTIVASLARMNPYIGYLIAGPTYTAVRRAQQVLEEALNNAVMARNAIGPLHA